MAKISVVIACVNGLPSIYECLCALQKERGQVDLEIVVVNCCKDGTSEKIHAHFPDVTLIDYSERLSIPELRTIGIAHSTGDFVAIIEDHCLVQKNWGQEILKSHALGYDAVGGAVENGSVDRIIDWAVFLCEYSHAMLPIASGETEGLPGNNVSYKREILDAIDDDLKRNYWEYFLHEALKKQGVKFLSVPTMLVSHKKSFRFLYFLSQRFHYSRSFAGMRRARVSFSKRAFYLLCTPAMPLLLFWRIGLQVFKKKRFRREFLSSFGFLSIFLLSYTVGEFIGYLFGPGKSLIKVE